ncbi:MAG: GspE/PulE family protein [Patescibacteria group bacterium]
MDPGRLANIKSQVSLLRREGEERAAQKLAEKLGYGYVNLSKIPFSTEALKIIGEQEAKDGKLAAIELKSRIVAVAALDPELPAAKKAIQGLQEKQYEVKIFVASLSGLEHVWELYKFVKPAVEVITGRIKIEEKKMEETAGRLKTFTAVRDEIGKINFVTVSPIELIETVLAGSISIKASDIHFEAEEKQVKIRFRIDGLLHDVFTELPLESYETLLSRLKLIAGLKINIKDIAQDGRFSISLGNKEIEIRVSIIPSEFGETLVMRILDPEATSVGLAGLGIRDDDLVIVNRSLSKPNGLILNTCPTGSGKTTTLYSFLRHINNAETKIITLEDPIEYRLEGVEQTQVDPAAGYDFAKGLRSIVRQDPDVILVGEIRDGDTADIALQAALTGHLVLSTLHTNDAIGAIPRLINLGAKPVTIGPAINLIIAQRLVRKLCQKCKKPAQISPDITSKISEFISALPARVDKSKYEKYTVYEPAGCDSCNNFGYRGRVGIFEFFGSIPELEEIVLKEASEGAIRKLSQKEGMVTMQQDGILKVLLGQTTFKEIENTTGGIEW